MGTARLYFAARSAATWRRSRTTTGQHTFGLLVQPSNAVADSHLELRQLEIPGFWQAMVREWAYGAAL